MVQVRVGYSDHLGEPAWKCLLKRLTNASSEFTEPWERQEVRPPESISKHILNAHVGLLRLTNTSLWLSPALGTRMVTLSPADAATTAALHELGSLALAAA